MHIDCGPVLGTQILSAVKNITGGDFREWDITPEGELPHQFDVGTEMFKVEAVTDETRGIVPSTIYTDGVLVAFRIAFQNEPYTELTAFRDRLAEAIKQVKNTYGFPGSSIKKEDTTQ